jgi:hypothetical protein
MAEPISLREAERKAFRTATDDGLWDILLGCFFLMFAAAPLLSERLGDFWSSAVFLPFWGLVYWVILLIRKHVVAPRVGSVKFGSRRKSRLVKFQVVMLVVNLAALILGILALLNMDSVPGQVYGAILGLFLLIGFSLAAYYLDYSRLYVYGLLVGLAPLVGEWLYIQGYAAHHGFPVVYGVSAGIMILTGLVVFIRLLRRYPLPGEAIPPEGMENGQPTG